MTVKCYGCDRRARRGLLFCSQRCAAAYAENLLIGTGEVYCKRSGNWQRVEVGLCCGCDEDADSAFHERIEDR